MNNNDPVWLSALRGRVGAAILVIAGLACQQFFPDVDQSAITSLWQEGLTLLGGVWALWSKLRALK